MTAVEAPHGGRESPFVGLAAYDQDDADLFFGRDDERKVLISNLRASRLTLLYARSGTGKSSLLRAGVAPRLRDLADRSRAERGSARNIPVVFSSWRDEPTADLIDAIEAAIATRTREPAPGGLPRESLVKALHTASDATGATLLVILDQFEEYLLAQSREATPGRFAEELAACVRRGDLRANFLIAIREDAYSGLGDLFKSRIDNVYGNYLHLENLSRQCARRAIIGPIDRINELHPELAAAEIEPELVEAVLDQLSRPEGASLEGRGTTANGASNGHGANGDIPAPYLQLVMKRLWEVDGYADEQPTLHLETLVELGGAETIVRTHVDRALDSLSEADRDTALDIFQHLVTRSGTKVALTASDLVDYTNRAQPELQALLERLTKSDARILRDVPPPPGSTETRFEIAHDLLAPAILTWRVRQRADRLERERNAAEQHAQEEARRARRFRMMAVALSVFVVALTVVGIFAFVLRDRARAEGQAATAGRQAEQARIRETNNPERALQVALDAANTSSSSPVPETLRQVAPLALRLTRMLHAPPGAAWAQFSGRSALATFSVPHTNGGIFEVWSLHTGKPVLRVPDSKIGSLASASTGAVGRIAMTVPAPQGSGPATLWNLRKQERVREVGVQVVGAAVSADEARIVTWNNDSVTFWNGNGDPIEAVPMPHGVVAMKAAISPSHAWATVLTQRNRTDKTVLVWKLPGTGDKPVETGRIPVRQTAASVALGPGGRLAVYGGSEVAVTEASHPSAPTPLTPESQAVVNTVTFSGDGRNVITASEDGLARVYREPAGTLQATMPAAASMKGAVMSDDGALVATAGNDGSARIWNARSGVSSLVLAGNGSPVSSVSFNAAATRLATTALDGKIRIWSVEPRHTLPIAGAVFDVRADPADPNRVGVAGVYSHAYIWDGSGNPTTLGGSQRSNGIAFSPDGKLIVATTRVPGQPPTADLWSSQTPAQQPLRSVAFNLQPQPAAVPMVTTVFHHPSFSRDDKSVVFATTFGAVIWRPGRAPAEALSKTFYPGPAPIPVNAAAFSPDGREIVTGQLGGITLWRAPANPVLADGQPARPSLARSLPLSRAAPVVTAAFSQGGRFVVAGDTLGRLRVWNVADHNKVRTIRIQAIPTDLGFSAEGHRILIGATDGTVRVWDWKTGAVLAPLQAHAGATRAVQYVPNHPNEILSAGDDGLVEISECPTCVSIPALEDLANRHFARVHTHKPR